MQELVNFSEYAMDLDRFQGDWNEVHSFVKGHGLSGIELLLSSPTDNALIPTGLVKTVHFPGWFGWVRTCADPDSVPPDSDPHEIAYYFGALTRHGLVTVFREYLDRAAQLSAAYGVLHLSHVELEEVFTRRFRYTSREVLHAAAVFLNEVCSVYPGGNPPVTLAFENLWWPGLTFRSDAEIREFTRLLAFDNWIFLLDTGHLMNSLGTARESEGILGVCETITSLSPEIVSRIRAVHLQCSVSGTYYSQQVSRTPPEGFSAMPYGEKMGVLMEHIPRIDEHRAFGDPACKKILELIQPDVLVHEFVTRSREELVQKLRDQRSCIQSKKGMYQA